MEGRVTALGDALSPMVAVPFKIAEVSVTVQLVHDAGVIDRGLHDRLVRVGGGGFTVIAKVVLAPE